VIHIERLPYTSPVAAALLTAALADLSGRYGGPGDGTPVDPAQFEPPGGAFLVAWLDGRPAGCGGWRTYHGDPTTAEIKRMYVAPQGRRRGVARRILHALEQLAAGFNYRAIRLETGLEQPEAIGLYESSGYHRIAAYGHHSSDPRSVCFEKTIHDKTRNA